MSTTTAIGKEGEEAAAAFLQRHGYDILCRNYRFRKAEVDIIARKAQLLVIVGLLAFLSQISPGSFHTPLARQPAVCG